MSINLRLNFCYCQCLINFYLDNQDNKLISEWFNCINQVLILNTI